MYRHIADAAVFDQAANTMNKRGQAHMNGGKIFVVGIGPGGMIHMTPKAKYAIAGADVVVGYTAYIAMIQPDFPGKEYYDSGMRGEQQRCRQAIAYAKAGKTVAVVSSGDSGIYGMAGLMLELLQKDDVELDIEIIPGVTAASAAAAVAGAPLMNDFAVVSLSDLMTPFEMIIKRIEAAAMGDFVICIYNPRSKQRVSHLQMAAELILKHQKTPPPVAVVRHAGREEEQYTLTTLDHLDYENVDMSSIVIVGNSQTYIHDGKMITPRGYSL